MEKERLADRGLHSILLKRLWNQIGWFWTFAGEQSLGEGCNEDDWNIVVGKNIVGRINA